MCDVAANAYSQDIPGNGTTTKRISRNFKDWLYIFISLILVSSIIPPNWTQVCVCARVCAWVRLGGGGGVMFVEQFR